MRIIRYLVLTLTFGILVLGNAQAANRIVLFEEGTQWNCPPCASLSPYFEQFLKDNSQTAIGIRYHGWWPGANNDPMYLFDQADHQARFNYYAINSEPMIEIDGTYQTSGFSSGYPAQWKSYVSTRLGKATPLSLSVTESEGAGGYTVTVTATSTAALSGAYKLRVALVQNEVEAQGGTNGETVFENVVQKMLPDAGGSDFAINANQTKTFTFNYTAGAVTDINKVFAVVWVQNDANKEVINCATDVATVLVTNMSKSMLVGAPDAKNVFTFTAKNPSMSPVSVDLVLNSGLLPNNWECAGKVGTNNFADTHTFTLAGGDSAKVEIDVTMTGGKGIASPKLTILPSGRSSSASGSSVTFISASNDVQTVVISADGGKGRDAFYSQMLNDNSVVNGTITSEYTSDFLSQVSTVKTLVYVAGANAPATTEIQALTDFMNHGGNLLITGEVIATMYVLNNDVVGSNFVKNMLKATYDHEMPSFPTGFAGQTDASGIGTGVSSALRTRSYPDGMYYSPDFVRPGTGATVFGKATGKDSAVALAITGANYKAVYMTIPLEGIADDGARSLLMTRILAWFNKSVQKAVTITAPGTTSTWLSGTTQQITWTVTGVTTLVIKYSLNGNGAGATWNTVTTNAQASRGFFNWNVPNVQTNSADCYIRIQDASDSTLKSESGPFTIENQTAVNEGSVATDFQVMQNYPNPFAGSTQVSFTLANASRVTLAVYDMKGALVTTVLDEARAAGSNSATIDASLLPAATYEYRMTTPSGTVSHLMTVSAKQ
jgi:hypothetical protein